MLNKGEDMLARILNVNWVIEPCPKCRGKMFVEHDPSVGDCLCCLMCGFNQNILVLDSKEKFDALAKQLNGKFGAELPYENKRMGVIK